jgi:DNA-binding winged helix-turn-helix (wHTH) protein/tetratricopeptide (TPR) repeat protein
VAYEFHSTPLTSSSGDASPWILDVDAFRLSRADEEVRLEPKVFAVLALLVANRERVISKTELLDTLWPGEHVSDAVLPRCVAAARKALGDTRSLQAIIQTVHGRGYRFVAKTREVAIAGAETNAALRAEGAGVSKLDSALDSSPSEGGPREEPFVGRDKVIASLRSAMEDAIAGTGRLRVLVGEPGIGKTRTCDEVAAEARQRGASVLVGQCIEGEGAPAYWPWIQVLRALAGERDGGAILSELGDAAAELLGPDPGTSTAKSREVAGEDARFRLFYRICQALREAARRGPRLIVLDDLHWADAPSLLLLRFAARELADCGLLFLGTYRDVELRRGHPLASLLGELARLPHFQRLLLRGLELADVESYLRETINDETSNDGTVGNATTGELASGDLESEQRVGRQRAPTGLATAIHELTEGNPFFVGEIVRWLDGRGELAAEPGSDASEWSLTLPQGAREAVGRRLDGLSDACNHALSIASVQGRTFDLATAERVLETDRSSLLALLDEAVSARILRAIPDDPARYSFAHAIVQQTVYEELTLPMRVRLHERTGEELEALNAGYPDAVTEELAHHFFQAAAGGNTTRAIEYTQRAARRAARLLAYEQAVAHYQRALQVLDLSSDAEARSSLRCELMLALGDEQCRCAERDAALQTFLNAADQARSLQRADLFARAALGVGGRSESGMGGDPALVSLIDEALAGLPESDVVMRSRLLSRMVTLPPHSYSMSARMDLSNRARALAAETDDLDTHAHALGARLWALMGPDQIDERLVLADEAFELSRRFRAAGSRFLSQDPAMLGHEARLGALLLRGDIPAADREIDATLERANTLREPLYLWFGHFCRTSSAISTGRYDIATTLLSQGMEFAHHASHPLSELVYRGLTLWMAVTRGEWAAVNGAMDILETNQLTLGPLVPTVLATVAVSEGRMDDARSLLDEVAVNEFKDMQRGEYWLFTVGLLSELVWDLDDPERAGQLFDLVLPYADLNSVLDILRVTDGSVAGYVAKLAVTLKRDDVADHHYRKANELNERMGARPAIAGTLYYEARWLLEHGRDRDRAFATLARAESVASQLGRQRRLEEVRELRARYA